MTLELTRTTFRRLVWLQLLMLVLFVATGIHEVMSARWSAFDADFNQLLLAHFDRDTELSDAAGVTLGAFILVGIIATVGLLYFKPWARFLTLLSWIASFPINWLLGPASWSSAVTSSFEVLWSTSDGALLLMAYGRGLGSKWFVRGARA